MDKMVDKMESKITYRVGIGGKAIKIPIRAAITFEVSGGEITFLLRDGRVRVRTSDRLIVEPVAANAINLSIEWE